METVILGTTPTIRYKFYNVDVSDIVQAYLTIEQNEKLIIEKDIYSTTAIGTDYLEWKLTQEETLRPRVGAVEMMCNWLTSDGTRGASEETKFLFRENQKEEVI